MLEVINNYLPYAVAAFAVLWATIAIIFLYQQNKLGFWASLMVATLCCNTYIILHMLLYYCSGLAIIITSLNTGQM